ncbi:hypothetical protein SO802_034664 [Lithocarpus litseifolius]|uniref:Ribosomal RNA-processing protein 8 n=1 Tax=Lithocarpus litseifolius TaxID=425828 RepID=A0AAW2BJH9_9ROSI
MHKIIRRAFQDDKREAVHLQYHARYQEQMSHWPEQAVNIIMKWLTGHNPSLVVADFGCGDKRLAKNVKNKVFSFDLVRNDTSVIVCDMSKDYSNKMFVVILQEKDKQKSAMKEIEWPELKPCLYFVQVPCSQELQQL